MGFNPFKALSGGVTSLAGFAGDIVGDITGSNKAIKAQQKAANLQYDATKDATREQARQFDIGQELIKPFTTLGTEALQGQGGLAGLGGDEAQQAAINAIIASPQYETLLQQGEEALLQNASATGGLRGGNTQQALMQYRPQLLAQLIESQYSKLGGLAGMGQASAVGQAQMGQNYATNVGDLIQQGAAARAGGVIAKGNKQRMAFNDVMQIAGTAAKAFGGF